MISKEVSRQVIYAFKMKQDVSTSLRCLLIRRNHITTHHLGGAVITESENAAG